MSRKAEGEGRTPGMMLAIFLIILISYLVYIMLLHPWERKQLLTQKSIITINVVDCESGYPINDAHVYVYDEQNNLVSELITSNGQAVYEDFPDCFTIKASFSKDLYEGVCIGSGEEKVVNFCYEYPQASPNVLHYVSELGLIGSTSGEVINEKEFDNIVLSFPLSNATVNYPSYFLYSNLLWNEGMNVQLTSINKELTKNVEFSFKLDSKRGDPTIRVLANNKVLFNNKVNAGEVVKTSIPKQELNETINIEIKCDFDGWMFWTTQDCNITDIKAVQEFYTPRLTKQSFNFSASPVELSSDNVELRFINIKESSGGVKASVNGVELFDSNSLLAKNYSATIPTSLLNLDSSSNQLVLEANPSADVYLRGVRLLFNSAVTEEEEQELTFYLTDEELSEINRAIINFFVKNIYLNGTIKFKVNDVYYTSIIDKAGWNKFSVVKEDLVEENQLRITAPEGRFELEELKITYE